MISAKGTLIVIGGNEDKGKGESESTTLEYIHTSILSRVVQESGGPNATIAVIPTASSIPHKVSKTYTEAFKKLGCMDIQIMDIRNREDAENPSFIELLKQANCVLFSGGNQARIVKYIGGTKLHKIVIRKYHNENFVIAGTSAGAMCMSQDMITGGGSRETLLKGSVKTGKGMGFIPELVIDSHFIQRRRFGRLVEAVGTYPHRVGVGLAEDTGLVIKEGHQCEVIGSGMMIIFDPRDLTHNNLLESKKGDPLSITNLQTHILTKGDRLIIGKEGIAFFFADQKTEKVES